MSEANTTQLGPERPRSTRDVDVVQWLRCLTRVMLVEAGRETEDVEIFARDVEYLLRAVRETAGR